MGGSPRVKIVACIGGLSIERDIGIDLAREHMRDPDTTVWIDVQDPQADEIVMLQELGFHPLALEDVRKGDQRPKIDEYGGTFFLVTYGVMPAPKGTKTNFETVELALFIARNYVVSIHRERLPAIDDAYARWLRGGPMLRQGVGFLVYTVFDSIIDAYFPIVDEIEDQLTEAEARMFTQDQENAVEDLLTSKRSILRLRRVLSPLREIFNVLMRRDQPLFPAESLIYFRDVHDHILRVLDAIDAQRELVQSSLDALLTITSNRLNATMKKLTMISAAAGFVAAIFGAWGMNFGEIPLAGASHGFFMVGGATIAAVGAALLFGRARGWL